MQNIFFHAVKLNTSSIFFSFVLCARFNAQRQQIMIGTIEKRDCIPTLNGLLIDKLSLLIWRYTFANLVLIDAIMKSFYHMTSPPGVI